MFHIVREIFGQKPALVFSDQSLGLAVFDLQAFCLALGISQSLAHNPAQCLGLLPIPGEKREKRVRGVRTLLTIIIVLIMLLNVIIVL